MPLYMMRNDITRVKADAIVNAANSSLLGRGGVDGAIHASAGPKLLEECRTLGGCRTGEAKITAGYNLPCKFVIHTVGPVWRGGLFREARLLASCYRNSLLLAEAYGCKSVAFPLISTGVYGYPKERALQVAMNAINEFLQDHEMTVYLVIYDAQAMSASRRFFSDIASYIDDHYVSTHTDYRRESKRMRAVPKLRDEIPMPPPAACTPSAVSGDEACETEYSFRGRASYNEASSVSGGFFSAPAPAAPLSLQQMLEQTDAGFSETLLKLIDRTGKKDSEIYSKANVSRQHFSKIRNNPAYKPTKSTAIAFAIALELDLEQTRDLIGRAGYALTNSSKFDVIITYFILRHNYNLMDINAALYEFDQSLLGA